MSQISRWSHDETNLIKQDLSVIVMLFWEDVKKHQHIERRMIFKSTAILDHPQMLLKFVPKWLRINIDLSLYICAILDTHNSIICTP